MLRHLRLLLWGWALNPHPAHCEGLHLKFSNQNAREAPRVQPQSYILAVWLTYMQSQIDSNNQVGALSWLVIPRYPSKQQCCTYPRVGGTKLKQTRVDTYNQPVMQTSEVHRMFNGVTPRSWVTTYMVCTMCTPGAGTLTLLSTRLALLLAPLVNTAQSSRIHTRNFFPPYIIWDVQSHAWS